MGCGGISGGRTGASAPTEMSEHLRRAACPHAAVMVRWLTGGGLRAARPTEVYFAVRRGGALPLPRAGKSTKRRQWRMQRGAFEEVPRLAATTVAGNRLARRWAREPRPYGGLQGVR